jgi:hypothetical protein
MQAQVAVTIGEQTELAARTRVSVVTAADQVASSVAETRSA